MQMIRSAMLLVLLSASVGYAQQVNRTKQVDQDMFTGPRAQTALTELARSNAAFAKAAEQSRRQFEARGYKPANIVGVVRGSTLVEIASTNPLDRLLQTLIPALHAQRMTEPDGFMVMTTWDDGNPNTWEGNFFWYRNKNSTSQSIDLQLNVHAGPSTDPLVWAEPGATEPNSTATATFDGVKCDNWYEIPIKVNKNVFGRAWSRIGAQFGICLMAGGLPIPGCLFTAAAVNLFWEGMNQLGRYANACTCYYYNSWFCP